MQHWRSTDVISPILGTSVEVNLITLKSWMHTQSERYTFPLRKRSITFQSSK